MEAGCNRTHDTIIKLNSFIALLSHSELTFREPLTFLKLMLFPLQTGWGGVNKYNYI